MVYDATKPPNGGQFVSADIRANFAALQNALGMTNLVADPTFLIWAGGDAAAPSHWVGGGNVTPTIARCGTGLGDTNRKVGPYCVKLTGGANTGNLSQRLITPTMDLYFQSITISIGCYVKCSAANTAQLSVGDGIGTTFSAFHSGSGNWEWLSVTVTISGSATQLTVRCEIIASGVAYFSGYTAVLSPVPVLGFIPPPLVSLYERVMVAGNLTVVNNPPLTNIMFHRPTLIRAHALSLGTATATTAVIVRPWHWDGAAFQPMYATQPTIAVGGFQGTWTAPDAATYRYRCFQGSINGPAATDSLYGIDITQIGTGTVGANLIVHTHYLQFARPLEEFLASFADVN